MLQIHAAVAALVVLNLSISISIQVSCYYFVVNIFLCSNVDILLLIHDVVAALVPLNQHICVSQSSRVPSYVISR